MPLLVGIYGLHEGAGPPLGGHGAVYPSDRPVDERTDGAKHDGTFVGLKIPPDVALDLALPGGEPADDLHVTLFYGKGLDDEKNAAVAHIAHEVSRMLPVFVKFGGVGRFSVSDASDGKDVMYASVDSPGLTMFRHFIAQKLLEHGIDPDRTHGYTPHVTLAYVDPESPSPVDRLEPVTCELSDLVVNIDGRPNPLVGGKGDDIDPSDVDPEQLALGVRHEMEHTEEPLEALDIALDHLAEDPRYYDHLRAIEEPTLEMMAAPKLVPPEELPQEREKRTITVVGEGPIEDRGGLALRFDEQQNAFSGISVDALLYSGSSVVGRIESHLNDDLGAFQVNYSTLTPSLRSRGIGNQMYRQLNDYLKRKHGKPLTSDVTRSASAERTWQGLASKGHATGPHTYPGPEGGKNFYKMEGELVEGPLEDHGIQVAITQGTVDGSPEVVARLYRDGTVIGKVRAELNDRHDVFMVQAVNIDDPKLRSKGIGKQVYAQLNSYVKEKFGKPLASGIFRSDDAEHLWQSLVTRKQATPGHRYLSGVPKGQKFDFYKMEGDVSEGPIEDAGYGVKMFKKPELGPDGIEFRLIDPDRNRSTPAGFLRIVIDRDARVGRVRTANLWPDYRHRGLGSQLYMLADEKLKEAGLRLASDDHRSDDAEALWKRFVAAKRARFVPRGAPAPRTGKVRQNDYYVMEAPTLEHTYRMTGRWKTLSEVLGIDEGAIARTTDAALAASRIDASGGMDREVQEIGVQLDGFVERLNTQRSRGRDYDRTPVVDPKRVASAWKRVLDVLSGMGGI